MMPIVKREVVSVTDAPFVDDTPVYIPKIDKRQYYSNSSPSCRKCLKERSGRGQERTRHKNKQKPSKSNTPIVIQLKDTLKAALRQKQRTLTDSHGHRIKEDNSVRKNRSLVEEVSLKQTRTKNDVKNLSALISVLEKSHEKNHIVSYSNLTKNAQRNCKSKLVTDFVLNNSSFTENISSELSSKPRSITDCDNVELICNDLNSSERSSITDDTDSSSTTSSSSSELHSDSDLSVSNTETGDMSKDELDQLALYTTGCPLIRYDCAPSECPHCVAEYYNSSQYLYPYPNDTTHTHISAETTHSENHNHNPENAQLTTTSKVVDTNTDTQESISDETQSSDSTQVPCDVSHDVSCDMPCDEEKEEEISEISEILPADSSSVPSIASNSSSASSISSPESNSKSTIDKSDLSLHVNAQCFESRNPLLNSKCQRQSHDSHQRQLLDIDIARKGDHSNDDTFLDTVYIDLTDTDVTFTVYYHHNLSTTGDRPSESKYGGYNHTHGHFYGGDKYYQPGFFYQMATPYMAYPQWYWSYMYPSLYNMPNPLLTAASTDSVPKTLMVPPQELQTCKYSNIWWVGGRNEM